MKKHDCNFVKIVKNTDIDRTLTLKKLNNNENVEINLGNTKEKMINEITELKSNKRDRCYWSFGMTDIDLFKMNDRFVIDESIIPGQHTYFCLSEDEIDKFSSQLKSL